MNQNESPDPLRSQPCSGCQSAPRQAATPHYFVDRAATAGVLAVLAFCVAFVAVACLCGAAALVKLTCDFVTH